MNEPQTNGTAAKPEKKPTVLLAHVARFEARDASKPAKDSEVKAKLVEYFKVDDEMTALEEKLNELKAKRTILTCDIVALRGMKRLGTKTRGTGQITARGEAAWIAFASADGVIADV